MSQLDLFDQPDPGLVSRDGTAAQKRGAAAAEPKSGTRRALVLAALRSFPEGATDEDLAAATDLDYSNLGPRRRELVAAGWCRDTGTTRLSSSGVQVTVWIATTPEEGR